MIFLKKECLAVQMGWSKLDKHRMQKYLSEISRWVNLQCQLSETISDLSIIPTWLLTSINEGKHSLTWAMALVLHTGSYNISLGKPKLASSLDKDVNDSRVAFLGSPVQGPNFGQDQASTLDLLEEEANCLDLATVRSNVQTGSCHCILKEREGFELFNSEVQNSAI